MDKANLLAEGIVEKRSRGAISAEVIVLLLILFFALMLSLYAFPAQFPTQWHLDIAPPLDNLKSWIVQNRRHHWLFRLFLTPFTTLVDQLLRALEGALLWLPWPTVITATYLLTHKIGRLPLALTSSFCLFALGLLSLWRESMQTLALTGSAVLLALLIGLPLGIWTARQDRAERLLRPILDTMQTMPAFVYLVPIVLLFGIARVPSIIATLIFAIPPAVRLTNLGLRQVSAEQLEAAAAFGSTPRQTLLKVQLPQALPTIMVGINQTIMMALAMTVIAALIGSGGLGEVVLRALRRLQVGNALEGGLAIVLLATFLDRLSHGLSQIRHQSGPTSQGFRLLPPEWGEKRWAQRLEQGIAALYTLVTRLKHLVLSPLRRWPQAQRTLSSSLPWLLFVVVTLFSFSADWHTFPTQWYLPIGRPIDTAVAWARVHLYTIGGREWLGTGPLSDFMLLWILNPLRTFLTEGVRWPALIALAGWFAYRLKGARFALSIALAFFTIALLGVWSEAMDTLSQILVTVFFSLLIGIPLGIWGGRDARVDRLLSPINNFLQTIPSFVYLVPVIMLFNIGRVPGLIASVLYALPPIIRLTSLGIRQVDPTIIEAANAFGSNPQQLLFKVQLPLARPSIMLGLNQTMMMALSMVIIAGLVGASGLGFSVIEAIANNKIGASTTASLAIILLAMILDRLTQALAQS